MDYKAYFNSQWPFEAAGYIKNDQFYPLDNISEGDKRDEVAVDPSFLMDEPDVFIHSHTTGWRQHNPEFDPRSPSYHDLKGQIDTAIEWAVCTTDGVNCSDPLFWGNPDNRPPLLGRDFIYNIQDCLSLAQDWFYQERGIVLPNQARTPYWHDEGHNFMEELFPKWGFVEIAQSEAQRGDVFLYAIRSPIIRHIGVYLGNNEVISHWHKQVSAVESYGKWAKNIAKTIRYTGTAA